MAKATVFNPKTGERKAVTVGDPNAFSGGFVLETPTDNLKTRGGETSGRTLEGTLPPEGGALTERGIPDQRSALDSFRGLLSKTARSQVSQPRGIKDILADFKKKGVDLTFNPEGQQDAAQLERRRLLGQVERAEERFQAAERGVESIVDLIEKKEEQDRAFANTMFTQILNAGAIGQLDPQEFDSLRQGRLSDSLIEKISSGAIDISDTPEEALVRDLAVKFPDAGITLKDSLEVAQRKSTGSAVFRKSVRIPPGDQPDRVLPVGRAVDEALFQLEGLEGDALEQRKNELIAEIQADANVTIEDRRRAIQAIREGKPIGEGESEVASDAAPAVEEKPIEKDIAQLAESGILRDSDIRFSLRKRGYSTDEINRSSVGSLFGKVATEAGDISEGIGSFFSDLF